MRHVFNVLRVLNNLTGDCAPLPQEHKEQSTADRASIVRRGVLILRASKKMEICNGENRLLNVPRGKSSADNREKLWHRKEVSSLRELIDALHEAFQTDHVNIDHVQDLMTRYKSNPVEWKKFAKFDRYRYRSLFFFFIKIARYIY